MVVAQQGHHVFGVSALSEASEAAQVTEERRYLPAMAFQLLLASRRHDQISHLRRQEAPQPAHALDFAYLVANALFELLRLRFQLIRLLSNQRIGPLKLSRSIAQFVE